jgi:hypothetical protein
VAVDMAQRFSGAAQGASKMFAKIARQIATEYWMSGVQPAVFGLVRDGGKKGSCRSGNRLGAGSKFSSSERNQRQFGLAITVPRGKMSPGFT